VSINIKIKLVLLMTKFESPIVLKLKLHVQFGKNAPSENCIIVRSQRFCETGTVWDRECSRRSWKVTKEKVSELHDVVENEPQLNFRRIVTACSLPETAG